ncbi:MAG: glycosyl transferase [Candidatus Omnitrophica bacterium CG08_land_8_20_14_0_20_41_16]|uniref:Glycosyl transferase n=1 Tax=Candidatus Sherwoodlollariibacterium unditelluris TaxID=1974757 RepID=A0A2G9YIA8_9BACT|nr:MAG: glycosyl transferase [Candidatus Omnitrophica bacterium CG23_combo_of_CG06-09_8_20_14_all_41_10]PIS34233.1 MAG: glycosyl transferase [Candidatus Omnitrophica bacterium CG08_land_8_20_14_0_20_41_16]
MPLLSVIVPVYNEAKYIAGVIDKVNAVAVDKEIIVVDDSSNDGTDKVLRGLQYPNLKVIHHSSNRGKGAAVLTGISQATGEYVIVQDADFEYDPADYIKLMDAIQRGDGDLILGARFTEGYHGMKIPKVGNRLLTGLMNMLFGVKLNDCFTCYKLMRKADLLVLSLDSKSFDIEIEILVKAIRKKMRIAEVPVSYNPRTYHEGKKIRIKDGIWAAIRIFRFRFS